MGLKQYFLRRAGDPSGKLSGFFAWMFNRANAAENNAAVDALELSGDEHVLDLGFGGGASFKALLQALRNGHVTAIDPTPEMVARALTSWAKEIEAGRLALRAGSADAIGAEAACFDAVLTVNTVYFWPDIAAGFAEVRRVLKPSGRFVISVAAPDLLTQMGFEGVNHRVESAEWYAEQLELSGFLAVQVRALDLRKPTRLIIGCAP